MAFGSAVTSCAGRGEDSLLRRAIEALLDATRHLLAKGFGLGALEYRQAVRLAAEKGLVMDPELQARFLQIAGFR